MNTTPQKQQTNWFQELQEFEAKRPAIRRAGIEALNRLVPVAQRGTGQSAIVGRFLLGLYNGHDYPFVLTSLRGLDTELFEDCLAVLQLDFAPEQEVHAYFPNGDAIWAELIRAWA